MISRRLAHICRTWIFRKSVPSYVVQLIAATAGAFFLAILLDTALALPIALLVAPRGSNLFDYMAEHGYLKSVGEPYFPLPILIALVLGAVSTRLHRSRTVLWVWALQALILTINVLTWQSYSSRPRWSDAWANFFGSGCGATECMYELFVTAPFYTSAAYSLGWIIEGARRGRRVAATSK